jgi:hypothetical protein
MTVSPYEQAVFAVSRNILEANPLIGWAGRFSQDGGIIVGGWSVRLLWEGYGRGDPSPIAVILRDAAVVPEFLNESGGIAQ